MSIKENQLAELAPVGWYGCPDSPIVFIGEGPGGVEDDYGCPLIGPSGQLLDKALWSVQMTRDRVLTSNIVKCRPKGNRTPDLAEAENGSKHSRATTASPPSIPLTFCASTATPRCRPSGTSITICS